MPFAILVAMSANACYITMDSRAWSTLHVYKFNYRYTYDCSPLNVFLHRYIMYILTSVTTDVTTHVYILTSVTTDVTTHVHILTSVTTDVTMMCIYLHQ